ncbi:MAG: hypothetical protein HQ527_09735 [Cyanobacteria bacterium]|nr:hypothetical protein [Cyanobacteria bacterium bin.51]
MTNLQEGAKPPSSLGRTALLLGLPITAGLLLSAVVVAGGVWQPWSKLRDGQNQLHALRAMEQRLPLLREQRLRQLEAAEKARIQQADLLQLIGGSGELSTFLAQLSREAGAAGVELDLFEPTPDQGAGARPGTAAAPPPGEGEAPPPAKDPLEAQGLSKSSTLLSARGRFPNLLGFMRRLERLGLLVVQSDLNLSAPDPKAGAPAPLTELKLTLSLYGKKTEPRQQAAAADPTPTEN